MIPLVRCLQHEDRLAGTTVAAKNANFTGTNTSITLQAQLAYSSNAAATAGAYTATIPLLVLYK